MKTTLRSLFSLLVLAAVALAPAPAPAGLFSSEKSRLLDKADAEYEAAKEAAKAYEVVRQITELRKSLGTYRQLSAQYPDYERQKVSLSIRALLGEQRVAVDEAEAEEDGEVPEDVGI